LARPTRRRKHARHRRSRLGAELRKSELLDRAVELAAERGFAGMSLKDLADGVGISRPAIYHYFRTKDELLAELVAEVTVPSAVIFDRIEQRSDLDPLERIREVVRNMVLTVANRPLHFRMMDRSEANLSAKTFSAYYDAKRRVLAGMTALIEAAMAAGQIRSVDPKIASFAVIGMCNWCAWWYRSGRAYTAGQIADQIADLAVHSLRRSMARDASTNIKALTEEVRDSLRCIDKLADGRSIVSV
jgi:AcrR family transcriptional regulator